MSALVERVRRWTVWPMLWKEFLQLRRDRLTFAMMTGLPAMQLLLFGYAIQTDVRRLPTVVLDESRTSESRALIQVLANTDNFTFVASVPDRAAAKRWIERGAARVALVIPPEYQRNIRSGHTGVAQMLIDAADPQSSGAAIAGAQLAAQARGAQLLASQYKIRPPVEIRVRPWYNPAQKSATFIVPGIVGILLTITMTLITSTAIVKERERGTLEQLIVTPISRTSLMLGKLVPFVLVGYVQMSVILALGVTFFDIPIMGSLGLLYALALVFIVASLGVGLLISTVARSQLQAMQLSFFFMLPNILLSGYIFPRSAMPEPAQWVGALLPLTWFLDILRGVLLKGVGMRDLWTQLGVLSLAAVLLLVVSVRRFSKTLD
ncbi:MAG: ABC transporter permease [Gemmatimonadota bacterium]|nr:ABC transporter permease [Gemmatimonadota bacterium]MDQ8167076.1 ABC transporter permease [Gemmatimonadota bacterium]MDQ8171127.1 ABC transporter permease [Gemmatimonadota bacterium]